MGERIRALWERLKADFHKNPALWIGLGISAAILVIAYLAYRKQNGAVVPANGYGFPNYGGATGGTDTSGGGGLGYQPYQPVTSTAPVVPASSGFTTPATAFPSFPAFSFNATPAPTPAQRVIGSIHDLAAPTPSYTVQGSIQNPTAAQTAQHISTAAIVSPLPNIQNPTATQDMQHRGMITTAPTHYTVPTIIPTTIRPQPTYAGRVA